MSHESIIPILAVESERISVVVKGLAIVGAAVLGGFGTGAVAQGAARVLTATKVPTVPLQLIRVLSAFATGWVVFLFVGGPGGSGLGGGAGAGLLPGGEGSSSEGQVAASTQPASSSSASTVRDPAATNLDVHVLEDALVQKKLGQEGVSRKKYFRLEGSDTLYSRSELENELVRLRKAEMPNLKHVSLLPEGDTASDSSTLIIGLKKWGDQEGFAIDTSRLGTPRD